jgi:hypothetical protein
MDIPSQITVSIKPELFQTVLQASAFEPGSTIVLKVLELRGDRALVDFGNFQASADIKIPVTLGEELLVKVQESGPQLKLALLTAEPSKIVTTDSAAPHGQPVDEKNYHQIQADLKQILDLGPAPQTAKDLSKSINNILNVLNVCFESFELTKSITEMVPRLQSHMANSGFFFEKMLETAIVKLFNETDPASAKAVANHPEVQAILGRDLKANLLALKSIAADDTLLQQPFNVKSLAALRRVADWLLGDITGQQDRAVKQLASPEPFQVFTVALPLAEQQQTAKLKIYYPKKQKGESKKGFQISLLLSMDRLGDLRTDFFLLENDLTVTFFVKDRTTQAKIQENYLELPKLLNPLFNQILLRVIVSENKIKAFDRQDTQISGDRCIDLRI